MARQKKQQVVRLKHRFYKHWNVFYFYDGQAPVSDGVIELPADKPAWIRRAYIMGFRVHPSNGKLLLWNDVLDMTQSAESAETAKSKETADEGSDAGRQPASDDGIRDSAEARPDSVSPEAVEGSGSDGAPVRSEGGALSLSDLEGLLP